MSSWEIGEPTDEELALLGDHSCQDEDGSDGVGDEDWDLELPTE